MKRKINLQFFAEEVEGAPSATNEETSDVEFEETDNETEQKKEDNGKPKNTSQQNKTNAQRRIDAKKKAEMEKQKYYEGFKKASGNVNRFTDKPLVDDEDIKEYEIMLELDAQGKDPIMDYNEYLKTKAREERLAKQREEEEKANQQTKIDNELKIMQEKYGVEKTKEILNDKAFADSFNSIAENFSLPSLYEFRQKAYEEGYAKAKAEFEENEMFKEARASSSSGSFGKQQEAKPKSISDMSDEEFRAFVNAVSSRK